jgi:hypothetical protein
MWLVLSLACRLPDHRGRDTQATTGDLGGGTIVDDTGTGGGGDDTGCCDGTGYGGDDSGVTPPSAFEGDWSGPLVVDIAATKEPGTCKAGTVQLRVTGDSVAGGGSCVAELSKGADLFQLEFVGTVWEGEYLVGQVDGSRSTGDFSTTWRAEPVDGKDELAGRFDVWTIDGTYTGRFPLARSKE